MRHRVSVGGDSELVTVSTIPLPAFGVLEELAAVAEGQTDLSCPVTVVSDWSVDLFCQKNISGSSESLSVSNCSALFVSFFRLSLFLGCDALFLSFFGLPLFLDCDADAAAQTLSTELTTGDGLAPVLPMLSGGLTRSSFLNGKVSSDLTADDGPQAAVLPVLPGGLMRSSFLNGEVEVSSIHNRHRGAVDTAINTLQNLRTVLFITRRLSTLPQLYMTLIHSFA